MPNEERGRLDSAIDRAVRGMMQVDPSPGLRHRVADGIEAPARRAWVIATFATITAVAMLILSVGLLRMPRTEPAIEPSVVSTPSTPPSVTAPQTPAVTARTEPEPEAPVTVTREPRSGTRPAARPTAPSIFGEPTGRVTATNVPQENQDKQKSSEGAVAAKSDAAGQPVNIKLELTFADQTGQGEPLKKVVTMVVADRGVGTIRSSGSLRAQGRVQINVEARPLILQSGAVRLTLALEYNPRATGNDAPTESTALNQRISTIVEPGKPIVISQAADPGSDRKVIVEVRATIMK